MRQPFNRAYLLATSIITGIAWATASSASAQVAPQDDVAQVDEIVVTGSRIARKDYVANTPIVTVDQQDLQATGSVTVDTLINDLPQFVPASNATSNNPGNGGQANVQLRGLEPGRTLVLLNGRRIVPSNASSVVDLNLIPTALIKSVETITGGASSTYGSDAVAGVLNFILDDSFDGLRLDLQYGQTDRSDGVTNSVNLTVGSDFADGKGNMVLALGYARRDQLFNSERDFAAIGGFSGTSPLGSTVFDALNLPSAAAVTAIIAGGVPANTFGFNNNGTLFTYQGARDFVSPGGDDYDGYLAPGSGQGGNFNYNTAGLNELILPQDRYNLFAAGRYELASFAEAYVEALFSQYETGSVLAPTPAAGTATGFRVLPTNPFIPAELRGLLASRPNPNGTFLLNKRFNALGTRNGNQNFDVYQFTTGVRGDLVGTRDWTYDTSLSYGRVDQLTIQEGNVSRSATQRLLDAPDGGRSLCAGGFNPFGETELSAACIAFIGRTSTNSTTSDQRVFEVNLQGGLFDLPAGEVRVALGGGYREQNFKFVPDALLATGDVAGFNAASPLQGSDQVYEVFGEVLLPLLADMPFIQNMEVTLGYRVSDYDSVGKVDSYKVDGNWTFFEGVTLRGGIQRAVRAPSIGELFSPVNIGFPNIGMPAPGGQPAFSGDPCDVRGRYRQPGTPGAAQVRALCITQGVAASIVDTYNFPNTQVSSFSGGNPDLFEETADSFTAGLVLRSQFSNPWLSNLSGSLDYYKIEIEDVIATVTATEQIRRCYNFDGLSNPTYDPNNAFCQLFSRDPLSGQINNATENNANLGTLRTSGVDFQVDYRVGLADVGLPDYGTLALNVTGTWLEVYERQDLPGGSFTDRTGTTSNSFGLTLPEWKFLTSLNWSKGPFTVGARWRYQGSVVNFNAPTETIDAIDYFDLNGSWDVNGTVTLRAGVNNLTDELAPVYQPSIASNTDPSTYDVLGRRYYVGLTARF